MKVLTIDGKDYIKKRGKLYFMEGLVALEVNFKDLSTRKKAA